MTDKGDPLELLQAFERSGDGVYAVDYNQRIVFWNRAARRLLGFEASEVLGKPCYDVIAGGDYAGHAFCRSDCPVIEYARKGTAVENYDVRTHDRKGKARYVNVSMVVLRGRSVKSTLAVHLFRDVTAQRRVQARASRTLAGVPLFEGDRNGITPKPLTRRETEVLHMLACGLGNQQMAETLGISATTIRNHVEHMLSKLGVHSKLEAVVYAARNHMV
ncbi:MAG TPA: LuxR C-terminal-related transcriptional regulator [Dehalococcoidia bacterium]|nr:LuxR C-terminal-related transcriptional regulator [Dehalococcoidia bacterium]